MAFATLTYSSLDGATDQFDVTFPYISASDVKVFLNGSATTAFSFLTTSRIQMNSMPASGSTLVVKRATSQTSRLVDYQTGGILSEDVLDTDSLQAFYMAQEAIDVTDATIQIDNATAQWTSENLRITNLATPTSAQDAATKAYADTQSVLAAGSASAASTSAAAALVSENAAAADLALTNADVVSTAADVISAGVSETNAASSAASAAASAAGIYWKAPVVVATTANITLSGEQTIDSILTSASRVLVKDQTAPAENGIYVTAAGAWSRAIPMDTWDEHVGAVVLANQGSINGNQAFQCTVTPGGTLDTTDVTFVPFGAMAVNFAVDNFAAGVDYTAGSSTTITLSGDPGSEENCRITFDGVMQHHNTWTLGSGDGVVTFDAAIPSSIANIEAQYGSTIGVGTPSDGTVSTVKIVDNAVTTAKIADDAVTLAKLATGTDGELITWDASGNPATVAAGTSTHILTSNGAGAAPTFQAAPAGGAWNLISSATASASSSIDFASGIDSTYDVYKLYIVALTPSNYTTSLFMRVKQSGISRSTSGDYRWRVSSAYYQNGYGAADQNTYDTEIELATGPGSEGASGATGKFIHYEITMYKPSDTTGVKNFNFVGYTANQSLRHMGQLGQGIFQGNTNAIDGLDFRMSSGTITVGGFYLYGLSKS